LLPPKYLYLTVQTSYDLNIGGEKITVIQFLGGCREVGRSAVLVDNIMMDYGMKPAEPPQFPMNGISPKTVVVSHGHLDHCGVVPNLMDCNPELLMTPPTKDLSILLAKDSKKIMADNISIFGDEELREFTLKARTIGYDMPVESGQWEITLYDAGHIPGSSSIHLEGEVSILYTGDVKTEDTRLLSGANTRYPESDILIVESTYFDTIHPDRSELERQFVDSIKETLDNGGTAIIPSFAIGRTQEVMLILDKYGITPYVDGMGKEVYRIIEGYPDYVSNVKKLKKAFEKATFVNAKKRKKVLTEPCVVVTTAGMLNGGPALYYISRLYNDSKSKILLTGYQVEETNGRMALDKSVINVDGRLLDLKMKVEQYDFSAHSDDRQLKELVKDVCDKGCEIVFTMHGENTEQFAGWIKESIGVDAYAPQNGDVFFV